MGKFFVAIRFDGDLEISYLQLVIVPFFYFYLIDKRIEVLNLY